MSELNGQNRDARKATRALGLVVLSLVLLTGLLGGSGPVKAEGATITLNPTPLVLAVNGTGFVDVIVGDFTSSGGLGAYTLAIEYDASVVRVTGVDEGDPPFAGGIPDAGNEDGGGPISSTDNETGEVRLVAFQASQLPGPTGDIRVARINFEAVGASGATSDLTFIGASTGLFDAQSGGFVPVTPTNGSVLIGGNPGDVSGKTTLQRRAVTGGRALVEISCPTSGFTANSVPDDDGSWLIAGVPAETCTITATAPGYLRAEGTLTVGDTPVDVPANLLLAGDSDSNNFININDITGIIGRFGQTAVDCEIEGQVVDVDCNDFVNINDITGAIPNFGKGTQPFPTP
ncbi:MAG TPA: cohesin domain-containing protein [Dehalococcoidia bacterium]|nr:cohesin domain-containing protein [Dehalococcoidia bacterium]